RSHRSHEERCAVRVQTLLCFVLVTNENPVGTAYVTLRRQPITNVFGFDVGKDCDFGGVAMLDRSEDVGLVCNSTVTSVGAPTTSLLPTRIRNARSVIWVRLAIALIFYASIAPRTYAAAPSVASLTPNSGAVGTQVKIAGSNFGQTQGGSKVT